jgi:predicted dehydrogenase
MSASTASNFTVGIVGAGNIVTNNHLPVLLALNDVHVAWVADKDASRARNVAAAYGIRSYDLAGGIGGMPPADCVLLAIPYGVREAYYSALSGGAAALFVEKPFARTVAMHRQICNGFEDHRLACGLNRRAMGVVGMCRNIIASRIFGSVRRARFGLGTRGGIAAGGSLLADARISGGGLLFEAGVHGIDTALFCLQAREATLDSGKTIVEGDYDIHCEGIFSIVDAAGDSIPLEVEVSVLKNTINRIEFEFDSCTVHFPLFELQASKLMVESRDRTVQLSVADYKSNYPYTWNQVSGEFWKTFISGVRAGEVNYTSACSSMPTTHAVEQLYSLAADSTTE